MSEPDGRDVVLVLDGQQRLTSLLIGLQGTFTVRSKCSRRNNPDAWSKQRLYIDLLKDPTTEVEDSDREDLGVTYGLRFAENEPKSDAELAKSGLALVCFAEDTNCRWAAETLAARIGPSRRIESNFVRNFLSFPGKPQRYTIFIVPPRQ